MKNHCECWSPCFVNMRKILFPPFSIKDPLPLHILQKKDPMQLDVKGEIKGWSIGRVIVSGQILYHLLVAPLPVVINDGPLNAKS